MNAGAIPRLLLAALILAAAGCASPPRGDGPRKALPSASVAFESEDLSLQLLDALGAGDEGALIKDEGWREYRIEVENRSPSPLTVRDVKLLNRDGRYLASAASYHEISTPPEIGEQIAGDVATRSAGIAVGQVVPYGGAIVGVLSSALSATASHSETDARRQFALRRIKDVELAPQGRVSGSAFLPDVPDARALVIDYSVAGRTERIELPLR